MAFTVNVIHAPRELVKFGLWRSVTCQQPRCLRGMLAFLFCKIAVRTAGIHTRTIEGLIFFVLTYEVNDTTQFFHISLLCALCLCVRLDLGAHNLSIIVKTHCTPYPAHLCHCADKAVWMCFFCFLFFQLQTLFRKE